MKKYLTQAKYKEYNLRRAARSLQARLRAKDSARADNRRTLSLDKKQRAVRQRYKSYVRVIAPEIFTLLRNTEPVISFINTLRDCFDHRRKVFVMLQPIKEIDYDAIVLLVSALVRFKAMKIPFAGDFPKEGECRRMLRQSGFLDIL